VRRYLRNPTFSRFDTIPECVRHTTTAYTALSIASRGKSQRPNFTKSSMYVDCGRMAGGVAPRSKVTESPKTRTHTCTHRVRQPTALLRPLN